MGCIPAEKRGPGSGAKKRPRIQAPQSATPLCGSRLGGLDGCLENGPKFCGHPISLERGGSARGTMAARGGFCNECCTRTSTWESRPGHGLRGRPSLCASPQTIRLDGVRHAMVHKKHVLYRHCTAADAPGSAAKSAGSPGGMYWHTGAGHSVTARTVHRRPAGTRERRLAAPQ